MNSCVIPVELVKEHWPKLNSTIIKSKTVWAAIAKKFSDEPFNYDLGKNPTKKIVQKWQNLQSDYKEYVAKEKQTGQGADETEILPPYHAELDAFLGTI